MHLVLSPRQHSRTVLAIMATLLSLSQTPAQAQVSPGNTGNTGNNADIRPLPSSKAEQPSTQIFPLGQIDGQAVFASSRQRAFKYQPGAICLSDSVLIKADPATLDKARATPVLIKAAQKLYHDLCRQKMKPDWRDFLTGFVLDEPNFQRLLNDETHDEYRPAHSVHIPLPPEKLIEQQQKAQAHWNSVMPALKANEAHLKALFTTHRIAAWVDLSDCARNPFTYADQTIMTVARLQRALSSDTVMVVEPTRHNHYGISSVVLTGVKAGEWSPAVSRLVVMKPTGRYKGDETQPASAEVVAVQDCKDVRCDDLLSLHDPAAPDGLPPVRLLKTGQKP